ncbi:MAG: DinB family protein [Acidobacteriota bacterium]
MTFDLDQTFDILRRTPAVLDTLLRGTSADWHAVDEGEGTWSALVIVGHLVHGEETDWMARARIILEYGPERPFESFDREAQFCRFEGWSLERLLDRFSELRRGNLETVEGWGLSEEQLGLPGRHPELGDVDLRQMLATWAVHDLGHIAQISRVMSKRYRDAVGPWSAYLSILNRP